MSYRPGLAVRGHTRTIGMSRNHISTAPFKALLEIHTLSSRPIIEVHQSDGHWRSTCSMQLPESTILLRSHCRLILIDIKPRPFSWTSLCVSIHSDGYEVDTSGHTRSTQSLSEAMIAILAPVLESSQNPFFVIRGRFDLYSYSR